LWTACAEVALGLSSHIELRGAKDLRDYVHVIDVARAVSLAAIQRDGPDNFEILNVASGHGVATGDFVEVCREVSGRKIPVVVHSHASGEASGAVGNNSAIFERLGWRPEHNLTLTLSDAWAVSRRWPEHNERESAMRDAKIAYLVSGKLSKFSAWRCVPPGVTSLSRLLLLEETTPIDVFAAFEDDTPHGDAERDLSQLFVDGLGAGSTRLQLFSKQQIEAFEAAIAACALGNRQCAGDDLRRNVSTSPLWGLLDEAWRDAVAPHIFPNFKSNEASRRVFNAWLGHKRVNFLRSAAYALSRRQSTTYTHYLYVADHVSFKSPTHAFRAFVDLQRERPTSRLAFDVTDGGKIVLAEPEAASLLFADFYESLATDDVVAADCGSEVSSARCIIEGAEHRTFARIVTNTAIHELDFHLL